MSFVYFKFLPYDIQEYIIKIIEKKQLLQYYEEAE